MRFWCNSTVYGQIMKQVSLLTTTAILISLFLPQPLGAEEFAPSYQCLEAITRQQNRLESFRLTVTFTARDVSQDERDYNPNKPFSTAFILAGDKAADVMRSGRMMQSMSSNILNSCPQVQEVWFGVHATDWTNTFGWVNNQVQAYKCVKAGREIANIRIPLGFKVCI